MHRQRQRRRQGWRSGVMTGSATGARLLQHQHPNLAARVACVPGRACSQVGTEKGPRLGALLPFPAGLAGCESPVSTAGLPGQASIWEEAGSGSRTPRGRELQRAHGPAWRQAQRPSCSVPLPCASVWPGMGEPSEAGSQALDGHRGTGTPGRVSSGVPPPQQEQSPIPASEAPQPVEGMGFIAPGTASIPMSGLDSPSRHHPAPTCTEGRLFPCTGRHNLADMDCWVYVLVSPCLLTRLPPFLSSQPTAMATVRGSRASFGPQHFAKAVAAHSHIPLAHGESHDTPPHQTACTHSQTHAEVPPGCTTLLRHSLPWGRAATPPSTARQERMGMGAAGIQPPPDPSPSILHLIQGLSQPSALPREAEHTPTHHRFSALAEGSRAAAPVWGRG